MSLFPNILQVVSTLPGWCSGKKAQTLAASVVALRPNVVVEIGVYGGRSLIPMAMACSAVGNGTVIGIDPWLASESVVGQPQEHVEWWGKHDHETIMNGFLAKVKELELTNVVKVVRDKSDNVKPPDVIDFLSVDGNHGPQALKDVERFAPHIRIGGLCAMDDVNWSGGNVSAACQKLLALGFQKLYHIQTADEDWAVFQRVK